MPEPEAERREIRRRNEGMMETIWNNNLLLFLSLTAEKRKETQ